MKITIAGCGNMGLIYAKAFIHYQVTEAVNLLLIEKSEARKIELEAAGMSNVVLPNNARILETDLLLLAVKPQDFLELSQDLKMQIPENCIVVSIMAGISMATIKQLLAVNFIVRAMPNSPAALGMAITGFICSDSISNLQREKVVGVLSATGKTVLLEDELLLNAVTALSGSGPAYFFYVVKHMIEAGKQMGLNTEVATALVKQTLLGSYHLLEATAVPIDTLIKTVASKGGTTEAALGVFKECKTGEGMQKAILSAYQRAQELAK